MATALSVLCVVRSSVAQQQSRFNQHELWNPLFYTSNGNEFRSASGAPGPKYWQNRSDYVLDCTLDTVDKTVTGSVVITYKNNSPDALPFLWLQVEQNIYRSGSKATRIYGTSGRFGVKDTTQGYDLKSVTIEQNGKTTKADYLINDTRMQIRLPVPMKPGGSTVKIRISYSFYIPVYGEDRMGRLETKNGWIYEVAQWYPRMEVYDDVEGWNSIPYLGSSEFYLDYGNFDCTVTAPGDMIVVAGGKLLNPTAVLTPLEISRLKKASQSDSTVMIRTPDEVTDPASRPFKGMLKWHFSINNARDLVWAASTAFVWDAARINLPHGKKALAQSVYPVESAGPEAWGRSTEFIKGAIELYSKEWYPFEYPVATDVAGTVSGMEYPGIVFCGYRYTQAVLWEVANHEFGHNWFPMTVGSNERKFAWMDEGFNTFLNGVDTKIFNKGEFYHKEDLETEAPFNFGPRTEPIMTTQDVLQPSNNDIEAYSKPAMALKVLRDVVLGKKRFDYAFRTYIRWWAFKHPTPVDFFRTMDNASGEDLDWFWREWFYHNYSLDQGVNDVKYVNNDPASGSLITLENYGRMAMPVIARISEQNGNTQTIRLPVEIWQRGPIFTFQARTTSKLTAVVLDPDHVMPDVNPKNNVWEYVEKKPIPSGVTAQTVIDHYLSGIGGMDKLSGIKDLTIKSGATIMGTDIVFQEEWKMPDKFMLAVSVPEMNRTVEKIMVNGGQVMVQRMGKETPVNSDAKNIYIQEANAFPELRYQDSGYKLELTGLENRMGRDIYIMNVTDPDGQITTNCYDAKSGLKISEETSRIINGKQVEQTSTIGDYREVNGIMFPFSRSSVVLNRPVDLQVKSIQMNTGLPDSDFQ